MKNFDLEKILNGLGSDEARSVAIFELIGKVDLSRLQIERVVDDYEKAGRFDDAANMALKAGMKERAEGLYQRAVDDYEKAGRFDDAANMALEAGMKERAEGLKTLADLINKYIFFISVSIKLFDKVKTICPKGGYFLFSS